MCFKKTKWYQSVNQKMTSSMSKKVQNMTLRTLFIVKYYVSYHIEKLCSKQKAVQALEKQRQFTRWEPPMFIKKQHGFLGKGKFTTCEWLMVLLLLELWSLCGLLDLQLGLFFSVHCQKWKVKIDGIKFWDLLFYSMNWSWYMSKMRWL
jgi:hypothetical protein